MKSNDELDKVELPALHQLQQLGWQYIPVHCCHRKAVNATTCVMLFWLTG